MKNYYLINIVISVWCAVIGLSCGILMANFESLFIPMKYTLIAFLIVLALSNVTSIVMQVRYTIRSHEARVSTSENK